MRVDVKTIKTKLHQIVWEIPLETMPPWQRLLINIIRVLLLIIRDLAEGQLTMRAMGLVYTTLLSMVPLLAVSFSVLKGFGVHNQVKPMLLNLLAPLGDKGIEITDQVIGFVDNIKVGVLGAVGLALLFYTVISLLQKIESSFNYTWRVEKIRPLSQRFSDYLSVTLIGPVMVFTAIGVATSITETEVIRMLMGHPLLGWFFELVTELLPYAIMTTVFSFVYVLFPNTRVRLGAAVVGGFVASILWQLSGWVFASFVVNSAKYTAIYSVFATLIIFLIWLYLNWLILLVGCSIAFYTQHAEYRNLRPRIIRLSNRVREKLGLYIMVLVGRHHYQKKTPWTVSSLSRELAIGPDACDRLVTALHEGGLLEFSAGETPHLLPANALETMRLQDILVILRQSGEHASISPDDLPADDDIDALFQELEAGLYQVVGERSLRDLSLPARQVRDSRA